MVIAIMVLLARAAAPSVSSLLPAWLRTRQKREDLLMEALMQATKVMTETVSVLQSLRGEVAAVRKDQAELRSDMEHIAEQLDLPRLRTRKLKVERVVILPGIQDQAGRREP